MVAYGIIIITFFSVFQNLIENEAVNSLSGNLGGSGPGWRNFKTVRDKQSS